ncbi:MAG: acetyl-CoA carboxylase biotin carboxyl carrier protein [Nitrospirae bacterium]|nr:acetyl-CoA carboxylase biotin carboxyl carrier protein [Nitrospirota bacterium]
MNLKELKELKELIDLVKSSELTELEWERAGVRVRICRGAPPTARHALHESAVTVGSDAVQGAPVDRREAEGEPPPESGVVIRSPIVGTFYRTASPGAPPYVEVGDRVRRGQILCIVEAMKLMNEIESEVDGVVAEVCVDNARPVEYGEALFRIEPS